MVTAFIVATRPQQRGDTFDECYSAARELLDEVIVIDGENTWPKEFHWPLIGEHFQKGYDACPASWVMHLDADFILHEDDIGQIRAAAEEFHYSPALTMWKYQFFRPDKYNLKSRLVTLVNKKNFKKRIRFNSGGDLCQPSLDNEYLEPTRQPEVRAPFYNYECLKKTEDQVEEDIGRMDRAYKRHFNKPLYSAEGEAFDGWKQMILGRYKRHLNTIELDEHPKHIQQTILSLKPEQFGYSGFGMLGVNSYAQDN